MVISFLWAGSSNYEVNNDVCIFLWNSMLHNFAESIYLSNISDDKQIDSFTKYMQL